MEDTNINDVEKNEFFISPIKTEENNDRCLKKKLSTISNKKRKLLLNLAPINSTINNSFEKSTKNRAKNTPIKLPPIYSQNSNSVHSKMKLYKVSPPVHREKRQISPEEEEKKVMTLLNKYADVNYKDNKFLKEDEIKKYSFNSYLRLQERADIRFKPRHRDTSNELVNYINKVSRIRKQVIGDVVNEISKKAENRYNNENPKVDFNFHSKEKNLIDNRWKNAYSLNDYQKYFLKNLQGKVSSKYYREMLKNFHQISLLCFSEGNSNISTIKKISNGI